jgi:hypothetical protein
MIGAEAVGNKDSLLHHEGDGFSSGLIGYLKPWCQTIYEDFALLTRLHERAGSPLDVDIREMWAWDAQQWQAYCRATLAALRGALNARWYGEHSVVINRALENIGHSCRDVYTLNGKGIAVESDVYKRLEVAVAFARDAVELIDQHPTRPPARLRHPREPYSANLYDRLAEFMFELLHDASSVAAPPDLAWSIQYNATWNRFFEMTSATPTWKVLQFKVRRLLYDEVAQMTRIPNYKGARILGLLLNIFGLVEHKERDRVNRTGWPLAKVVRGWAKQNYLALREELPEVAGAVLIGWLSYEVESRRLVKTYMKVLSKETPREYMELASPEPSG